MDRDLQPNAKQAYREWIGRGIKHVVQISYPRCGRRWLSNMVAASGGFELVDLERFHLYADSGIWKGGKPVYAVTHPIDDTIKTKHAKYIYLIRDPRDAILSNLHFQYGILKKDCWEDIDYLYEELNIWRNMFFYAMGLGALVVQFERLCLYTAQEIRRVLRFIDRVELNNIENVIENIGSSEDKYIPSEWGSKTDKSTDYGWPATMNGTYRYSTRCLKWSKDTMFEKKYNDITWEILGDIAVMFGYLPDGHSEGMLCC